VAQAAGTDFHSIFQRASRTYDHVIILSDMQGWMRHHAPVDTFRRWKEHEVCCLAGFSDKTLETLKLLDANPDVLIHVI
jgi:hypothetical protein